MFCFTGCKPEKSIKSQSATQARECTTCCVTEPLEVKQVLHEMSSKIDEITVQFDRMSVQVPSAMALSPEVREPPSPEVRESPRMALSPEVRESPRMALSPEVRETSAMALSQDVQNYVTILEQIRDKNMIRVFASLVVLLCGENIEAFIRWIQSGAILKRCFAVQHRVSPETLERWIRQIRIATANPQRLSEKMIINTFDLLDKKFIHVSTRVNRTAIQICSEMIKRQRVYWTLEPIAKDMIYETIIDTLRHSGDLVDETIHTAKFLDAQMIVYMYLY